MPASTKSLEFLHRFRPFGTDTPSHDQLGKIFATLDAEKFQRCFVVWVALLTGTSAEVIAIETCCLNEVEPEPCPTDVIASIGEYRINRDRLTASFAVAGT